jgi:formylglycine-generating enzyme required for sulfatase activity
VLEGLKGKAKDPNTDSGVTWDSLRSYVKTQVARDQDNQSPEETGNLAGVPPLLLRIQNNDTGGGDTFENKLGMKFVLVKKGSFWMGSPDSEKDREPFDKDSETQKEVTIDRDFYIGVTEITQGQWQEVMGYNPSYFSRSTKGAPDDKYEFSKPGEGRDKVKDFKDEELKQFPVENVSWDDIQEFLKKLNERERGSGFTYRLPTEEQWEYACRGGPASAEGKLTAPFYLDRPLFSLSSRQANFDGNHPYGDAAKGDVLGRTTKVGSYPGNQLGLRDMHGNVWERTDSLFEGGPARVSRGGGWLEFGLHCRAAYRSGSKPSARSIYAGARLARVSPK